MAGEVKLPSEDVYVQYCASSLYLKTQFELPVFVRRILVTYQ